MPNWALSLSPLVNSTSHFQFATFSCRFRYNLNQNSLLYSSWFTSFELFIFISENYNMLFNNDYPSIKHFITCIWWYKSVRIALFFTVIKQPNFIWDSSFIFIQKKNQACCMHKSRVQLLVFRQSFGTAGQVNVYHVRFQRKRFEQQRPRSPNRVRRKWAVFSRLQCSTCKFAGPLIRTRIGADQQMFIYGPLVRISEKVHSLTYRVSPVVYKTDTMDICIFLFQHNAVTIC